MTLSSTSPLQSELCMLSYQPYFAFCANTIVTIVSVSKWMYVLFCSFKVLVVIFRVVFFTAKWRQLSLWIGLVLNTPDISVGLMIGIGFCNFSIFYFVLSLFNIKSCFLGHSTIQVQGGRNHSSIYPCVKPHRVTYIWGGECKPQGF